MIATRLHAKRHSCSTANRPSVISIHSTSHHLLRQQHRKSSRYPSEEVQIIDSDVRDDNSSSSKLPRLSKVEKGLLACLPACLPAAFGALARTFAPTHRAHAMVDSVCVHWLARVLTDRSSLSSQPTDRKRQFVFQQTRTSTRSKCRAPSR